MMIEKGTWYQKTVTKICVRIGIMSALALGIMGLDQSRIKEVRIGDNLIGYAKSEQVVQECFEEAKNTVNAQNTNRIQWSIQCDFVKGTRDEILTQAQLQQKMVEELDRIKDTQKQLFYCIKVGDYTGVVKDRQEIESILEQVQENYSHTDSVSIELVKETKETFVPKIEILKKSDKKQRLVAATREDTQEKAKETKKKTTLGVQNEEIIDINFEDNVQVEQTYVLPSTVDTVEKVVQDLTTDNKIEVIVQKQEIEYKTYTEKAIYVKSDQLYKGEKKVVQKAKTGIISLTNVVEYANGEVEKCETIQKEVIQKAVPKKVLCGTKERPTFIYPLEGGRFTSPFGMRWGRLHAGVDWACSIGTPVKASSDGIVIQAGWMNGYGNCVTISHANGMATRYGHMSQVKVQVGQKVSQGELVGLSGNTGRSTGPHLHFEIHKNGTATDPLPYLP